MNMNDTQRQEAPSIFSGNIYIFSAFDVGDEIDLERVRTSGIVTPRPFSLPKYFKHYHLPLAIDYAQPDSPCVSTKLHNFGTISRTYKIPFESTLEALREQLDALDDNYQKQSALDVESLYKDIKQFITKPTFFQTRASYLVIQINPHEKKIDSATLKEQYGSIIASALRFETATLSEYQKNDILRSSIGYFKGDLVVIDTDAAFVYDPEYEELLDFFEFANIQSLELRYFDQVLDQQLNLVYEGKTKQVPIKAYLPFVGTLLRSPIDELGKLKVDISVISERLESSIRLVGEPYYAELYQLLIDKLDIKTLEDGINRKLSIIHDVRYNLQTKIDTIREDLLTVLIIILIFIEAVVGILH